MGWKNWPYWLRGGIIGMVISFLLIIIISFLGLLSLNMFGESSYFGNFLGTISSLLFIKFNPFYGFIFKSNTLLGQLLPFLVFYFIIGAIIGWIYGKRE